MRAPMLTCVADLYESTLQAFEFLVANGLVIPGAVFYFDDWIKEGESMRT